VSKFAKQSDKLIVIAPKKQGSPVTVEMAKHPPLGGADRSTEESAVTNGTDRQIWVMCRDTGNDRNGGAKPPLQQRCA
jgi:hypothetical protein